MSSKTSILIAGATGYIGGSILKALLDDNTDNRYSFSALIRDERQAARLVHIGVQPILFEGLNDLTVNRESAKGHDGRIVVINCANSAHPASAKAWIQGLADRQNDTGRTCFYIQTAGTSAYGDQPVSEKFIDTNVYSDQDDVYAYEKAREEKQTYGQRDADIATVEAGEELGVRTYIIMPPTIYGKGTGESATITSQVPNLIRLSLKYKQAVVIGSGEAHWCNVHILDLADLYASLLRRFLNPSAGNPEPPSGRSGIYFAENGEHTWLSISQTIGRSMLSRALSETDEARHLSLKEAAGALMGGDEDFCEIVLASNARTRAVLAKKYLGWKPKYTTEDFHKQIDEDVNVVSHETGGSIGFAQDQFLAEKR